jgi:hypothetical protein
MKITQYAHYYKHLSKLLFILNKKPMLSFEEKKLEKTGKP